METIVIQKTLPGKSAAQIISRVKEIRAQVRRNETELVKLNTELGWLFTELKAQAPGTWGQKLLNEGYSQRVVSRLMKAAKVLAPGGTIPPKLAEKLPSDPIKLEALAGLGLDVVETLIRDKVNLRQKDRGEIAELVRERQDKQSNDDAKPTGVAAVRKSWSDAVEALFKKMDALEGEEREQFIAFLETSLDDLKNSLHATEEEGTEPEGQDGDEAVDQEVDGGEDAQGDGGESDTDEAEATKEEKEVPEPKAPASKGNQPVGRARKQSAS